MQKRLLRSPIACFFGGLFAFGINRQIMLPVYEKDLEEMGLSKYYSLDLNADMMREDLRQMKIMRLSEQEKLMEKQIKEAKESKKN